MRRTIRGALLGLAAIGGAAVPAQSADAVTTTTPEGPATVSSTWRGPVTAEGRMPEVLQAVKITVGPGGVAGQVRLRVSDRAVDPGRGVLLGEWVTLPAEPGTYTFPTPRLRVDYRSVVIALDQQTGGHAIVEERPCQPELGRWADICQLASLDLWTPILPDGASGAPPEADAAGTPPTLRQPGRQLQVAPVIEYDGDGDLAGDRTEDRTDLAVRADAVRGRDGRTTITVANRGPRTADVPWLTIDRPGVDRWEPACVVSHQQHPLPPLVPPAAMSASVCRLAPLVAGEERTVSVPTVDDGRPLAITVSAEGPDLADGDNAVSVVPRLGPAPAATLRAPARTRATRGVRIRLRSEETASAQLRLNVRFRGAVRTTTRTVSLRAGAARSLALPAPRVRGKRVTGRAALTATVTAPGHEPRTVRRTVRLVR